MERRLLIQKNNEQIIRSAIFQQIHKTFNNDTFKFHSRFYLVDLVKDKNGRHACNIKPGTPARSYYLAFYHYYDATVYSYLPLSSMFIFNSLIVAKLIQAKCGKKEGGGAGSTTMSKVSDSVTIMLVAVCILFAITTTPYAAMYGINSDVSTLKYAFMLQGVYINHSANFIIYMIFNKRFRSEVKTICGCRSAKVGEVNSYSIQTDGTANTATTKVP